MIIHKEIKDNEFYLYMDGKLIYKRWLDTGVSKVFDVMAYDKYTLASFSDRQPYSLAWLINKFDNAEQFKFLFFWGHTNKHNEEVGKFCFSQWYELPFTVDDVTYKTAEHWMMANKALLFNDVKTFDKIINAHKPGEVKELGRQVMGFDDIVWNAGRFDIVVKGNIHKFNQHPTFARFLLDTNDRILVEASPVDKIWGMGLSQDAEHIDNPHFWNGLNLLGFALMEARDFFKEHGHFNYLQPLVNLPWKAYPNIHPFDMFWRMGNGEDHMTEFSKYYATLSTTEQLSLKLSYPPPPDWKEFYD